MAEAVPVALLEEFPIGLLPGAAAEVVGTALEQGAPLLLRGACDRARAKWTDAWLIALFEGRDCNVTLDSRPGLPEHARQVSLERYLEEQQRDRTASAPVEYLFHTTNDPAGAAERLADLDLPPALSGGTVTTLYRFFTGPSGAGSLPHVHVQSCAINALVRGRKRWAIYQEDELPRLEAMFRRWGPGTQARDWFVEECPALRTRGLRLWEFVQEAGDVVLVPKAYVHGAVNLAPVTGFTVELARR